jgi:hypothetical protein
MTNVKKFKQLNNAMMGCRKIERERNDKKILLFNLNETAELSFMYSKISYILVNMATIWLGKKINS